MHYSGKANDRPDSHDSVTRAWIAARLAGFLGYEVGGEYEPERRYPGHLYFVPADTLMEEQARSLGISKVEDLFGGVVSHAFLATKAIFHPLMANAASPPGWARDFGSGLADSVLHGYTAFSLEDARRAGRRLLEKGDARVKAVHGIGGRDQWVVTNAAELDATLDAFDTDALRSGGVVIEQNLEEVTTYSVGQVRVGDSLASYTGTQRLTPNNHGLEVYGGSDLTVARGDYDALLELTLAPEFELAIERARAFDAAVSAAYPGLLASRRNYDLAHGRDAAGKARFGLLEQSWRMGGASSAEIMALEAFRENRDLEAVQTCCVELYGEDPVIPPEATTYYSGIDKRAGRLTKYALIKDNGIAT